MGPVQWVRLAERRIVWEPRCRQSLGMSALGWEALNATLAVSALCAVCVRGVVSLVAVHTVSHGGERGFCFWSM